MSSRSHGGEAPWLIGPKSNGMDVSLLTQPILVFVLTLPVFCADVLKM